MPRVTGGTAANVGVGGASDIIGATQSLIRDVGPGWGLAIVVCIFIFMPRFGVLVHLAQMFKEDRADSRKQKLESDRLTSRYRNRAKPPVKKEER